jgi:hypothetical protein
MVSLSLISGQKAATSGAALPLKLITLGITLIIYFHEREGCGRWVIR